MLKVGLTGGIGSGKTTVSRLFEEAGAGIIDTDLISHQLSQSPEVVRAIGAALGDETVNPDSSLNRAAIAEIIFGDNTKKQQLEAILHPKIRQQVELQLQQLQEKPYVIIVVPLLLETDFHTLVDRVLVVDVPVDTQKQRVIQRDDRSEQQVQQIIDQQCGRDIRLQKADDVIDNSVDLTQLQQQVKQLHQKYLHKQT